MATTVVLDRTRVSEQSDIHGIFHRVIATSDVWTLLIARIGLGLIFLPHGLQKIFGLFGGPGFSATMDGFTGQGVPVLFAFLAIMAEFLGPLGLLSGFLARIAAFGILCNMVVATLLVHLGNGFFMNWGGSQAGEGFEYHLLAISLALVTIVGGAGRWSIDRTIDQKAGREY